MSSFLQILLTLCILFGTNRTWSQPTDDDLRLEEVMSLWEQDFGQLDIPTLQLSYVQFLSDIIDTNDRSDQREFFSTVLQSMASIDKDNLSKGHLLEYSILDYECRLHLQQLDLLDQLPTYTEITEEGIFHQPLGPEWYQYLLRHWTSTNDSPDEIRQYGLREARRIKRAMKKLRPAIDSTRYTGDPASIEAAFRTYEDGLSASLTQHFPDFPTLPEVRIVRGTNPALSQAPGYYGGNQLSYNLFEERFDLHQIPWLYLHEAIPGHHFQLSYEQTTEVPRYREQMRYSGFREGWAAYVEEVAHEVGLYPTVADRLSQMEWDLIRSVRLILDVGINYDGWTDAEALTEWQKYIEDLDDIGTREIKRMRRWPAQVLTYKVGAKQILAAREQMSERLGARFSLKQFHSILLSERSIPVVLVDQLMSKEE